jgi:hypothetical protein
MILIAVITLSIEFHYFDAFIIIDYLLIIFIISCWYWYYAIDAISFAVFDSIDSWCHYWWYAMPFSAMMARLMIIDIISPFSFIFSHISIRWCHYYWYYYAIDIADAIIADYAIISIFSFSPLILPLFHYFIDAAFIISIAATFSLRHYYWADAITPFTIIFIDAAFDITPLFWLFSL